MREIMFRAWNDEEKVMISADDLAFETYLPLWMQFKGSTLTFMQYTGLNDKNDKEIYEGDIIEIVDSIGSHICVVKFINGCFVSVELGDSDEVCLREDIDNFPHTIIGNIYENTELLSKTN